MNNSLNKILIQQEEDGKLKLVDCEGNNLIEKAVNHWFKITQRLVNLLYEVKEGYRLDKGEQERFRDAVKAFGWSKQLELNEPEFIQNKLDPDPLESPYLLLSYYFDVKRTLTKQQRDYKREAETSGLYNSAPEDDDIQALYKELKGREIQDLIFVTKLLRNLDDPRNEYVDESGNVGKLYDDYDSETKVWEDIQTVKALRVRYDDLWNYLYSNYYLSDKPKIEQGFHEAVMKALAIGYSAGLNANTTQILRKSKANNSSEN